MTGTKNPYSTVFWNDIEHDEKLKTCSLAAKGLWLFNMLPAAARSPEYGVVIIGDWPSRLEGDLPMVLANVAGQSRDVIEALLEELVMSGTASVDDQGRVFNRRMVKERKLSQARSESGRRGALSRWGEQGAGENTPDGKPIAKGMANGMANGGDAGNQQAFDLTPENDAGRPPDECDPDGKPMAASCFGASYRESLTEERGASRAAGAAPAEPKKRTRRRVPVALPDDWQPDTELATWTRDTLAATNAVDRVSIDREVLKFRGYWRGKVKSDWPKTWQNWIWKAIEWSERNGTNGSHQDQGRPARSSAIRTAANLAAALGGLGARGSGGPGRGEDGDGVEAADAHDHARKARGGE